MDFGSSWARDGDSKKLHVGAVHPPFPPTRGKTRSRRLRPRGAGPPVLAVKLASACAVNGKIILIPPDSLLPELTQITNHTGLSRHAAMQKMKRILFEALAAAFMTFGAISVLITIESIKVDFRRQSLRKGEIGGTVHELPTPAWLLVTVTLFGIAFFINCHARRLRIDQSPSAEKI